MNEITGSDLRWIAGIVDTDGSIYLELNEGYYRPKVEVAQNKKEIIYTLKELTQIGVTREWMNEYGAMHRWRIGCEDDVKDLLTHIEPFLILKRVQALTVLQSLYFKAGNRKPFFDIMYTLNKRREKINKL